jgi:type IV pilus assembly protein PilB
MRGTGCSHCNQTGYRGRIGIFEMMKLTSIIRELTFTQAPTQQIRATARKGGMRNLLEDGVLKVLRGQTTLEEVLSTCHAEVAELTGTGTVGR